MTATTTTTTMTNTTNTTNTTHASDDGATHRQRSFAGSTPPLPSANDIIKANELEHVAAASAVANAPGSTTYSLFANYGGVAMRTASSANNVAGSASNGIAISTSATATTSGFLAPSIVPVAPAASSTSSSLLGVGVGGADLMAQAIALRRLVLEQCDALANSAARADAERRALHAQLAELRRENAQLRMALGAYTGEVDASALLGGLPPVVVASSSSSPSSASSSSSSAASSSATAAVSSLGAIGGVVASSQSLPGGGGALGGAKGTIVSTYTPPSLYGVPPAPVSSIVDWLLHDK